MGGRQSSSGGGRESSTQVVPVPERGTNRNSSGTASNSRDSSRVGVTQEQPRTERRHESTASSLRATRTSRPSSSYAGSSRSMRERARVVPHSSTYSSSAPASNNPPLDIGLLLGGLRDMAVIARIRCPVCRSRIPISAFENHMLKCLEPKLSYNVSQLDHDAGECIICLEDMLAGNSIARLPCLCIYHQKCIEKWLKIKQSCPEHPTDLTTTDSS